MEHFESFCQLVQEYIDLFDHLIQIEEEKIEAVNKNQITFVENCMNHEQAAVLKLRGLELQREKSLEELGCSGLSFRQIIEKRPDFSPSLLPLFNQLSERVQTFRSLSDSAKDLIEVNLHVINSVLSETQPNTQTYTSDGDDQSNPKHFTSRSV